MGVTLSGTMPPGRDCGAFTVLRHQTVAPAYGPQAKFCGIPRWTWRFRRGEMPQGNLCTQYCVCFDGRYGELHIVLQPFFFVQFFCYQAAIRNLSSEVGGGLAPRPITAQYKVIPQPSRFAPLFVQIVVCLMKGGPPWFFSAMSTEFVPKLTIIHSWQPYTTYCVAINCNRRKFWRR